VVIAVDKECGMYPWEITAGAGTPEPFCLRSVVNRQVPGQTMDVITLAKPVKMLLIAGSFDNETKNALPECKSLKDYIERELDLCDDGVEIDFWDVNELEECGTKNRLLSQMMRYDIVHYTGHGVLSKDPSWSGLQIRRKQDDCDVLLSGYEIMIYLKNRPQKPVLFFLNACNTGEGLDGRGVGYDIVRAGIPCCIGTMWKIDDDPNPIIAKEFYRCFLKEGLPYGESFRRARAMGYEKGHKSWMQYAAYGNPMIRVIKPTMTE
jgi:CHAT domain-containing protein